MKTAKTLQHYQSIGRKVSLLDTPSHDDHNFCVHMGNARSVTLKQKIRLEALAAKYL